MKQSLFLLLTLTALALVCAAPATAQEITGVPGSPSATTTIDGKQLPPPDPKFGGVIKEKRNSSRRIDFRPGRIRRERFDLTRDLGGVRSEVLLKHRAVVIDHEGHNA